jgi:hypothetical protein
MLIAVLRRMLAWDPRRGGHPYRAMLGFVLAGILVDVVIILLA